MKGICVVLLGLFGPAALGIEQVPDRIIGDSEVMIVESCDVGATAFLVRIDGKEHVCDRIKYVMSCRNGAVKAEIVYVKSDGTSIIEERRRTAKEYAELWRGLMEAGLEELAALPLDEPVDPFEFIDSWRLDQESYEMHFRLGEWKASFHLYDLGAYRDLRFRKAIEMVEDFLIHKRGAL